MALESTDGAAGRIERGEAYQAFRDAEMAIERASTDLTKAKMDFNKMDELLAKGFVTRNDYLEDELKVTEAERKLESTRLAHFILRTYEHPKSLAKFRAELRKAGDELKQTELSAAAQLAQKDAAITQAQAVYEMRTKSLTDTRDRIAKMTIVAPDDGLVLYGDERRPWDKENIKVGGRATEGSPLITFPSVGRMIAATKVPGEGHLPRQAGHAGDSYGPCTDRCHLHGQGLQDLQRRLHQQPLDGGVGGQGV